MTELSIYYRNYIYDVNPVCMCVNFIIEFLPGLIIKVKEITL